MVQDSRSAGRPIENFPTPTRPRVDSSDVVVPDGDEIDPVVAGLIYPTDIAFDDDGTVGLDEISWMRGV